jgi:DNA-directed RNA polymerase specialized sigma24 family protein
MPEMTSEPSKSSSGAPRDYFATTHWTVVLAAGKRQSPQSARALEELCRIYWYPLYAYVRRQGSSKEDAEDSTQAFFARLLERNSFDGLSAEKGKVRAFLLASLKNFLVNEWKRSHRQKRGGGAQTLSLDWQDADSRYHVDPPDHLSPDKLYDRAWAVTLLDRVIRQLRQETADEGKAELFDQLKAFLVVGKGAIPYAQTAAALGLNETTLRVAVHRLRKRYRALLREEISQTLSDPGQVDEEMRALFDAFAR